MQQEKEHFKLITGLMAIRQQIGFLNIDITCRL